MQTPKFRLSTATTAPLLLIMVLACNATAEGQEDPASLSIEKRAAYAIGVNIARQLGADGVDLDTEYLSQAITDVNQGNDLLLDDAAMAAAMQELQAKANEARQAKLQVEAEANSAKGRAFLTENKSAAGVVETATGLQYVVLTAGEGAMPAPTDRVTIHYTGSTLDGTVFDSSVERGTPTTLGVNQFIPGFSEALTLMSPGAKHKVWIPDTLGYGLNVRPGSKFGPNELLVFEVELLEIVQ